MSEEKKVFRPSKHLLGDMSIGEMEAIEEEQYENLIVKYIFDKFRLSTDIKFKMLGERKREFGVGRLTLDDFYYHYPTFPVYLFARKIRKIKEDAPLHRWFSDFARRKFTRKLEELRNTEVPDDWDGPVGLVFHWPHLRGNPLTQGESVKRDPKGGLGLVVHTGEFDADQPGVRFRWVPPRGGDGLTVEPLSLLFNSIRWTP